MYESRFLILLGCGFLLLFVMGLIYTNCGSYPRWYYGLDAEADVDLEAVAKEFARHARGNAKDLAGFERAINEKKLYTGEGYVKTILWSDGSVVGFVDSNSSGGYEQGTDKLVFKLEPDHRDRRIIASDRYHHHYGLGLGDLFGLYFISRMFNTHYGYYGGWRRYDYDSWVGPGYFGRYRRSNRWGSPAYRGGRSSWGGGFRSGGWSFGK